MNRYYVISYTRSMANGKRIFIENSIVSERNLKQMLLDDSKFKYVIFSARLEKVAPELKNLYLPEGKQYEEI